MVMGADPLRQALRELLTGNSAHISFEKAVANIRPEWRTHRAPGRHSVWQLVEHIRVAQEDILRYTLDPSWVSPEWPEGYWPENRSDLSETSWSDSLSRYGADLEELLALLENPEIDLGAAIPHGEGRTYVRQLLLVADHTAYHTGQIVSLRRSLGDWPPV
jgi:uncharacterized damage-inducible protein DinB